MMEDNDWLKGLQSKMKDYEEPAPEGLWENIESSAFPEKKRRVIALPILWRSVGVAAAVALGVFAGLRFLILRSGIHRTGHRRSWLPVSLLQSMTTEVGSLLWKSSGRRNRKNCWRNQYRFGNVRPRLTL